MEKITMQEWEKVGSWEVVTKGKTLPLRVSEEIYWHFLECLPPQEQGKTRASFYKQPLPVQEYFLVGEPYTHINEKPVYACFCRAYDSKYFFLGYLPEEKSLLQLVTDKDKEGADDWEKRAESGETMRII